MRLAPVYTRLLSLLNLLLVARWINDSTWLLSLNDHYFERPNSNYGRLILGFVAVTNLFNVIVGGLSVRFTLGYQFYKSPVICLECILSHSQHSNEICRGKARSSSAADTRWEVTTLLRVSRSLSRYEWSREFTFRDSLSDTLLGSYAVTRQKSIIGRN